jgi:hypothetical protein
MTTQSLGGPAWIGGTGQLLGWIARGILVFIALFWLWFCIADGIGDAKQLGIMGFIMMLPAAIIVLGALYIVWRWEYAGAYVLLGVTLLGAMVAVRNAMQSTLPSESIPAEFAPSRSWCCLPIPPCCC